MPASKNSGHRAGIALLIATFCLAACTTVPPGIEGVWKHSDKPAWIGIRFEGDTGTARIEQHKQNADAVGQSLLVRIQADPLKSKRWRAEIYSAEVDDFVGAVMTLLASDELVVWVPDDSSERHVVLRLKRATLP